MLKSNLMDFDPAAIPITGDTRARLLEAGLRLFALKGYDSVTTRELAKMADVNIAAIAYHFGGKQELYLAVVREQVAETEPLAGPVAVALKKGTDAAAGDRAALSRVVAAMVTNLLRAFIGDVRMRLRAALLMREYAVPSSAFDIIFKGRIEPVHKAVTAVVAAALDRPPEEPRTIVRAHAVMGQIMIFLLARFILFARADWRSFGDAEFRMVCEETTASVLASLGLPPCPSPEDGS